MISNIFFPSVRADSTTSETFNEILSASPFFFTPLVNHLLCVMENDIFPPLVTIFSLCDVRDIAKLDGTLTFPIPPTATSLNQSLLFFFFPVHPLTVFLLRPLIPPPDPSTYSLFKPAIHYFLILATYSPFNVQSYIYTYSEPIPKRRRRRHQAADLTALCISGGH